MEALTRGLAESGNLDFVHTKVHTKVVKVEGFDWDSGNWPKCGKHGVSREEIEQLFTGGPAVHADPDHSLEEQRLRAIGRSAAGRWIFVAFTLRMTGEATRIRPISARYMRPKEVERYERQRQEQEE